VVFLRRAQGRRAGAGTVVVSAERGTWALAGDVLVLLERAACAAIPPFRDDKAADPLASRNAQVRRPAAAQRQRLQPCWRWCRGAAAWLCAAAGAGHPVTGLRRTRPGSSLMAGRAQDADDYSKDYVERDERRLTELGRRAVEMFAAAHIFAGLQEAHSEAESIRRQDALIQEVRVWDGGRAPWRALKPMRVQESQAARPCLRRGRGRPPVLWKARARRGAHRTPE